MLARISKHTGLTPEDLLRRKRNVFSYDIDVSISPTEARNAIVTAENDWRLLYADRRGTQALADPPFLLHSSDDGVR